MNPQHEENSALKIRNGAASTGTSQEHLHGKDLPIITGALNFREMTVQHVMTPASSAFMLPVTTTLSHKTLAEVFRSGYSRVPIFGKNRDDILGLILVKASSCFRLARLGVIWLT